MVLQSALLPSGFNHELLGLQLAVSRRFPCAQGDHGFCPKTLLLVRLWGYSAMFSYEGYNSCGVRLLKSVKEWRVCWLEVERVSNGTQYLASWVSFYLV